VNFKRCEIRCGPDLLVTYVPISRADGGGSPKKKKKWLSLNAGHDSKRL